MCSSINRLLLVIVIVIAVFVSISPLNALKCYTGFKFISGQTFGNDDTKQCEEESDYCYNMTAQSGILLNLAKAGCSTYRCYLSQNDCVQTTFQGIPVSFCCCNNEDFCNARNSN